MIPFRPPPTSISIHHDLRFPELSLKVKVHVSSRHAWEMLNLTTMAPRHWASPSGHSRCTWQLLAEHCYGKTPGLVQELEISANKGKILEQCKK